MELQILKKQNLLGRDITAKKYQPNENTTY